MMQKIPAIRCHLLDTGYCLAWENHVIQGGQHTRIACPSLVALLHHPRQGWMLWDTGYAPRMLEVTQHLPFSLYRRATPLRLRPELAVVTQLARFGLRAEDIGTIFISHFHADHIAGLRDFPTARYITLETAYIDVAQRKGVNALRRGFIPALLPDDFQKRVHLLPPLNAKQDMDDRKGPPNLIPSTLVPTLSREIGSTMSLGPTHDVFADGSLLLVELPGHARGQIGLLAHTERGDILFAADGCWLTRSIREQRPPSRLTHLFIDDARAMRATIQHLHDFSIARPDVVIIPSHCPEAFAREVEQFS